MKGNLSLLFNKTVFINISSETLRNKKYRNDNIELFDVLINTKLSDLYPEKLNLKKTIGNGYQSFTLTTSGQGLLVGTGNEHGTGTKTNEISSDGNNDIIEKETHEFKMGFHFDHTTGIPVITGHNLKGRLRSFFPIAYGNQTKKNAILGRLKKDLKDCFSDDSELNNSNWTEEKLNQLQEAIFEGKSGGKRINPLLQDTFLGAYPSKSNSRKFAYSISNKTTNNKGKTIYNAEKNVLIEAGTFIFEDTLANHPHPLKNPNPIRLLKILPDIEITFQFKLNDQGGLSCHQKATFFKYLLNKYGAGAKTSSGYGQFKKAIELNNGIEIYPNFADFSPLSFEVFDENNKEENILSDFIQNNKKVYDDSDWPELQTISNGNRIKGTIIEYSKGNAKILLHIKNIEIVLGLQGKFEKDNILNLIVTETIGSLKKGNFNISRVKIV